MSCKCRHIGDNVPVKSKPIRICHCRKPNRFNDDDPVKEQASCCCSQICSITDSRHGCQEHGLRSGVSSASSSEDEDARGECLCTNVCRLDDEHEGCVDDATSPQGGPRKRQMSGSDRQTCGCLDSSGPIPKLSCFSMDSTDLQYMEHVKNLVSEDSRLKKELDDLTQKEDLMKKTMELWQQMSSESKSPTNADILRELNPEIIHLRSLNKELGDVNESLTDALDDLHLEREQVDQKIYGPLTRELDRLKRKDIQLSGDLAKSLALVNSITRESEVTALREQVKRTKANIEDLSMVNDGIKNEVIVINYRCSQMEDLLLDQKKGEIDAINRISGADADACSCDEDSLL